jgi:hypothetical protein
MTPTTVSTLVVPVVDGGQFTAQMGLNKQREGAKAGFMFYIVIPWEHQEGTCIGATD